MLTLFELRCHYFAVFDEFGESTLLNMLTDNCRQSEVETAFRSRLKARMFDLA